MYTPSRFNTTRWTVVLQASQPFSPEREAALAELLQSYWYPLYGFVRRQGFNEHEAEDLLQGFIARLLEKDSLQGIQEGQGRFRNFLLVCLRNYLANVGQQARAKKRGGAVRTLSFDAEAADARYRHEPVDSTTPQKKFERDWALELIQQAFARLAANWDAAGKRKTFDTLKQYLVATDSALPYAAAAKQLGTTEGALKTAVHRLRGQFRQILCDQVATTLHSDDLLEDEIRRLFTALSV